MASIPKFLKNGTHFFDKTPSRTRSAIIEQASHAEIGSGWLGAWSYSDHTSRFMYVFVFWQPLYLRFSNPFEKLYPVQCDIFTGHPYSIPRAMAYIEVKFWKLVMVT